MVGTTHIAELSRLADLCEAIPSVRDKASRKFSLSLEIKRAGYILRNACGRSRTNSYMRYSPVRAYPQLITGRENVSDLLSRLWGSLRSAACVSATLYLDAKDSTSASRRIQWDQRPRW